MTEKLLLICLFTMTIHMIETLSHAVRLAGVRVAKLAVAISLFNMAVIVSRTANTFQATLTGSLVDAARGNQQIEMLKDQFHIILGSASLGTVVGMILLPTFVGLFSRAIIQLEHAGSIPQLVRNTMTIHHLTLAKKHLRWPKWEMVSRMRIGGIPKRLLLLNIVGTAVYTVGVLAALYASVLAPEFSATAQSASGWINGLAVIVLLIFVDPKIALLTEQVMQGKQELWTIDKIVGLLMVTRLLGTLLAQILLLPAAHWVAWVSSIFG
ncbi:lipid II flippase Amj family protein [Effusibacillus lacus]|uniref:Lipid II flippase Amj n=1 Tax=Effusibacillus lacus TaxID=1348429 RepID=A0A292YSZ0_9BACL|nr:lipid II flippase Amj family protein [Effusibacillus lacus]TCS74930.1 uncharacterized protein DUF2837 [Effusibacillus lacus]GAX91600.1 membrane protein [Effusibacillus lacus]